VVKKGKGKGAVIHVDRMRKLPNELSSDNSDSQEDNMHSSSQPKSRRKASDAAMETSTHCTMTANCTDTNTNTPLFQPDGSLNVCTSDDLDTSDTPGTAYRSLECAVAAVGMLDSAARPFPRSARRRWCLVCRLGDVFASAVLIGQRVSRVVGCLACPCIRRNRLPDACVIRRVTAVKRSVGCVVSSADSSSNFDSMPNKPNKRRNLPDVEPSDTDSSSSDWERDVLPAVISKPSVSVMRALAFHSHGMAAGGRPGIHRGQGMRGLPPLGCGNTMAAARAVPLFGKSGRGGPQAPVRGYIPHR